MGTSLGGNGRRRHRAIRSNSFSEINITPMVDVMLVLLVIFMVAAPMMTTGITVDLPQAAANPVQGQDEPLIVGIQRDGKIFIGKTPIGLNDLQAKLNAIAQQKKDTRVFLKADGGIDYSHVVQVMSAITTSGLYKVSLLTDASSAPTGANKGR
jgi:biopolymer transport protein TolR